MASVEIDDDEIVDAIIARPELVLRAFEQIKECADSRSKHHQRWANIAAVAASATPTRRAETTGSVGAADGGAPPEGGDAQ